MHMGPPLVRLLNVWDVASARAVAARPDTVAIATASAAIAAAHGFDDGEHIPWPLHQASLGRICAAVTLPVTADIERGYGDPVATVLSAMDAGVAGINLEDDLVEPAAFASTIRRVIDATGEAGLPIFVNARTDEFLRHRTPPLGRVIARGVAYLEAGADCVFMPGLVDRGDIEVIVTELGRQRVSLLALPGIPSPQILQDLGVARLSYGPALQRECDRFITQWEPSYFGYRADGRQRG